MDEPVARKLARISPSTLLTGALILFFVVLSIPYAYKVLHGGTAIVRWRLEVQNLDRDIYEEFNYPNPPIMAILLTKMAQLPPLADALCWFYLKAAMTLLAIFWTFRIVESPGRPFPVWAKVLTVLLAMRPIMGDFQHGNINLFILFLVIGSLFAYCRNYDWTSGVVLGLAIACKVTPALFVPYFLWKRAWKCLAGCALGLVLFLFIVPASVLGVERNRQDFASWWKHMVEPYVVGGQVTSDHPNQSLPGLLFRLGSASPSFYDQRGVPYRYDNLLSLDPKKIGWLLKGCMALFAGLIVWTCRTPTQPRSGWRLAAEFSLVIVGMLMFSERTWKHHCVTLLLPFGVLCYYLAVCKPTPALRTAIVTGLVLSMLLMASTSTSLVILPVESAKMAQVYGAYLWIFLILAGLLAWMLRRGEPAAQGSPAAAPASAAAA
jgi:hypothetical protein